MTPKHRLGKAFDPEYRDLNLLRDHANPSVQVIAVHGLAAHPVETWLDKKERWNWLEHQLVDLIPRACVWTFGYNSDWCGDHSVSTSLSEVASKLLDAIKQKGFGSVPLIFVAHSFGGLVVMKALTIAENTSNRWSENGKALGLFQSTHAMVFFGTPFYSMHKWFPHNLPELAGEMIPYVQGGLFRPLEEESEVRDELRKDFINKCYEFKRPNVGCIWETQHSNVGKILGDENIPRIHLVPKDAACLDGGAKGAPRFQSVSLERNHFNMHDFGHEDPVFGSVESLLKEVVPTQFLKSCAIDTGQYPMTEQEKDCLKSLAFVGMDQRRKDVGDAAEATCNWISAERNYSEWLQDRQQGILWIKGNAGQGKSTLMKKLISEANKDKNAVIASFFFDRSGVSDQKNILGLLQALLHQIIREIPSLLAKMASIYQNKCDTYGKYKEKWTWHESDLHDFFKESVLKVAEPGSIRVYVDAFDECDEKSRTDALNFFQSVAGSLKLCVSRRHYPPILVGDELEVEIEEKNSDDIRMYLSQVKDIPALIRDKIGERSSGNFQWVTIAAKRAREMKAKGKKTNKLLEMIRSLPSELNALYGQLLQEIEEDDKQNSLHVMQWIHFALRPLSLNELRFAVAVSQSPALPSIRGYEDSDYLVDTDEDMEKQVRDLSKGLADVVTHGENRIVRFIHESVNDFLFERGFQFLGIFQDKHGTGTLDGRSHFRLSRSCLNFVAVDEARNLDSDATRDLVHKYPFMKYAAWEWIPHAVIVEGEGLLQTDLFSFFGPHSSLLQSWVDVYHFTDGYSANFSSRSMDFLHIISGHNFISALGQVPPQNIEINSRSDDGRTPISYAAERGNEAMVRLLIERYNADPSISGPWGETPLSYAAANGHEAVVRFLAERPDVNADSMDYRKRTPLLLAASNRYEAIVRFLVGRSDVNANSRDFLGQTPLSQAARRGDEKVVRFLTERPDVEADSKDDHGQTPLSCIAEIGDEKLVRFLADRPDVDPDSRTLGGHTPLSYAAQGGHEAVVRFLAERPDVHTDSRDIYDRTPLLYAAKNGYESIVRFLVERSDSEADSKDEYSRTPLSYGAENGHEAVVRCLVSRSDVRADSRDLKDRTPSWYAARGGHKAIVKLLGGDTNDMV